MKDFKEKEFVETPGGHYDSYGFYRTLNGSFWDPDGVYFNNEGVDKNGGKYDNNFEYIPGPGWLPEYMCYENEKDQYIDEDDHADFKEDIGELDELYGDVDYGDLIKDDEFGMHPNKRSDNFGWIENQNRNDYYGNNRGNNNRQPNNNYQQHHHHNHQNNQFQQHHIQNQNQNYQQKNHQNNKMEEKKPQQEIDFNKASIYNSIPDDKKMKYTKANDMTPIIEEPKKTETVLKADDLFSSNDLFMKMDKKELKVNYGGFEIKTFGDEDDKVSSNK